MLRRYVTKSDDAWSIALIAFWQAVDGYREEKGNFQAYARLIIRRRLIDYQRREIRHAREIDVAPETLSADSPPYRYQTMPASYQEARLREEIADVSVLLARYGFTFDDLPDCSPKSHKTKESCRAVSAFLLERPALIKRMRRSRRLPVKTLAAGTRISRKLIERHRSYIIAVVEIICGDYPELGAYLTMIGKRGKA